MILRQSILIIVFSRPVETFVDPYFVLRRVHFDYCLVYYDPKRGKEGFFNLILYTFSCQFHWCYVTLGFCGVCLSSVGGGFIVF